MNKYYVFCLMILFLILPVNPAQGNERILNLSNNTIVGLSYVLEDLKDAMQSFGVIVAGKFGKGRFFVFGDDAIFQNQFLKKENQILGQNLARWLHD